MKVDVIKDILIASATSHVDIFICARTLPQIIKTTNPHILKRDRMTWHTHTPELFAPELMATITMATLPQKPTTITT